MSRNRLLNLPSILNFRDFGDYETSHGQRIRSGKLFRSAHLADANAEDLTRVENLNIGLVVDLRYNPERKRQPNRWPESQSPEIFQYPDSKETQGADIAPHEMFVREDLRVADDARQYMNKSYAARPHDPGFIRIFSDTLRFMAETGEPILIHCAAGKDRTGTLAAIIHGALGVDSQTVMQDYMLTMTAVDIDKFLDPAAAVMTKRYGRAYDPEALRPMFGVEPSYLENALTAISDMQDYITNTLGITAKQQQALRDKYLVS